MLKVGRKVYLHIKQLDVSLKSIGFNINRLCIIKEIEPVEVSGDEKVGVYKLVSVDGLKEYSLMSNDNIWKLSEIEDVVEAVKVLDTIDTQTKEAIIFELLK